MKIQFFVIRLYFLRAVKIYFFRYKKVVFCFLFYSYIINIIRLFQERHAMAHACTHTHAKALRSMMNYTSYTTSHFYYIITCVWSRCVPIFMLLRNRWLSLIIKLKLDSWVFCLWKLLILQRNQKGFLLSPVYKHLKGTFVYTRNEKGTQSEKTSNK